MDVTSMIHLLEHYGTQMMLLYVALRLDRGLNAMISLCEVFAKNFDITFNCRQTVCINL